MAESVASGPCIGILALQGAFEEHRKIVQELGARTVEVRLPDDLDKNLDGLIIPGGESTAMAIVGERHGIFPKLKAFVQGGKPIWGTCAGMILLSNRAIMQKAGGQPLIGGLDVEVCRNFFGSQVSSFEVLLQLEGAAAAGSLGSRGPVSAVFIRAPAILEAGPGVEVLARVKATPCAQARHCVEEVYREQQKQREELLQREGRPSAPSPLVPTAASEDGARGRGRSGGEKTCMEREEDGRMEVVVAVQQGHLLATAFHPELTPERWWHQYFMSMCSQQAQTASKK
ncbi:glutamine amidotransferase [Nannochloropsis gaditana CCMP526]|uniref:glutamine amidotransferase n=1 Tax=Nannochloropsis gaditana (strain CCMP526) TaxID=1093141 RepID=UPI00029F7DF3|nr:glutamine amidotransferase [Nannochloropsis gaditana CCMP526]EKU21834.1 glutamine amidotransferase [Nannochloropsis gaditana CCMP526]|eukprot:XP_005854524.1 glutamine amidotransferase [Nannochloropsis gaditana CCMP526]